MELGQRTPVGSVESAVSTGNSQEKEMEEGSRREQSYQGASTSHGNPEGLNAEFVKILLYSIQLQFKINSQNLEES